MKYPALSIISVFFKTAAVIFLIIGLALSLSIFAGGADEYIKWIASKTFLGSITILLTIITSIAMFAYGELIKLFIDIEQNLRIFNRE